MSRSLEGRILVEREWVLGRIHFDEDIIDIEADAAVDGERCIIPGFIDCHVHGGGGFDCMDGKDAVHGLARYHRNHGTTTLLATTVTAPLDDIDRAFDGIAAAMAEPADDTAQIIGVHLEGPFISPDALGAQPPFAIPPDIDRLRAWHEQAPIRVATFAPEIDADCCLLNALQAIGCRAQIGHTTCTHHQALHCLKGGAAGFTHIFNAMSGLHHRQPGCAGAALASAEFAEIILDFHHVDATAARAALRAIPKLYGITDSVAASGMPGGTYHLGQNPIHTDGETARLADGTLAGSVLTMDRVLRNFISLGLDLAEASSRCATIQAEYLGLADRGRLKAGLRADLNVVDGQGHLQQTLVRGSPAS